MLVLCVECRRVCGRMAYILHRFPVAAHRSLFQGCDSAPKNLDMMGLCEGLPH